MAVLVTFTVSGGNVRWSYNIAASGLPPSPEGGCSASLSGRDVEHEGFSGSGVVGPGEYEFATHCGGAATATGLTPTMRATSSFRFQLGG